MLIFEKLLDNYNANEDGVAHLNTSNRQYNYFHRLLGEKPGINLQRTKYYGFSDVGLFTSWIHGHEIWSMQMVALPQYQLGFLSKNLNQVEAFRARAKLFNKLLKQRPTFKLNNQIAKNIAFSGRRIGRTEMAYRISHMSEQNFLKDYASKWFFDRDISVNLYGNVAHLAGQNYYHERMLNTTRGDMLTIL